MAFFKRKDRTVAAKEATLARPLSDAEVRRATRTRSATSWFTCLCLAVAVVFLIIVEIGNLHDQTVLRDLYFIKLNLSNIVPVSVANSVLLNSIAQTLGLPNYIQVGLWNYCQTIGSTSALSCTKPETLYWFNPVQIISSQIIDGAVVQLPDQLSTILDIIHIASNWMFGLFLAGACLSFVLAFALHAAVYSRWAAFALMLLAFFNALMIAAASVIATVMFVIMRNVFQSNTDVNIGAEIGTAMFACMWVAAALAIIAFLFQLGMCCCCASRRDVRTGRKRGSKKAYTEGYA